MSQLTTLDVAQWRPQLDPAAAAHATRELEAGNVLFLPHLKFTLADAEQRFLSPAWSDGKAKNVSYDPIAAQIRHSSAEGADRQQLAAVMARFAQQARELVSNLCPCYAQHLRWGFTSFRPIETRGRATSRRKDDTRVHVDAFASRPSQGLRILRVFCNVNPHGEPRVWELGEPFSAVVQRFRDRVAPQWPGSAWLFERLRVTKGRRSAYDHIMLNLHDRSKLDDAYQQSTPKTRVEFPAQSTWIVFTDRVMHAALAGQYLLEQTLYLPVAAMQDESCAPLRILERIYQRRLA
jgi:3-deoxy-D-manno-octulosonic acid hydroxylase-like protein